MRHFLMIVLFLVTPGPLAFAAPDVTFTSQERDWIAANPVINVAVDDDWRPLEYIEKGAYKGLSAEYLRVISRLTGLQFRWVPSGGTGDDGRQALLDGRVQLLPALADVLAPTSGKQNIAYSKPYFVGATMVVTRADSSIVFDLRELNGKTVALKAGGVYERVLRERFPHIEIVAVGSVGEALEQVAAGHADAAVAVDSAVMPALRRQHVGVLHIAGTLSDMSVVAAMGVRAQDVLLLSIINKSLASLTALETDEMLDTWMEDSDYGEPTWNSLLRYYGWELFFAVSVLLVVLVLGCKARMARNRAERSEREKAWFIAMMSHEVRTPMNAILSSVELLRRSTLNKEQDRLAAVALDGANTLIELLNDVLDYSKMEAGKLSLDCKPIDLGLLLQQLIDIYQPRAEGKGVSLSLDLQLPENCSPVLDAHRIRQILHNLLSNALKFTNAGSINVAVTLESFSLDRRNAVLCFSVSDTGIGIPLSHQGRLFQAFSQMDRTTTRKYGGTGLGLAICKELVERMQGYIELVSEQGRGTNVKVHVPTQLGEKALLKSKVEPIDFSPPPKKEGGCYILVVEDHPQNRFVIEQQLNALGCSSRMVGTGMAGLIAVEEERFDMLLLDCNLPDMDGYSVAARIRERQASEGHRLPIIAISALSSIEHLSACEAAGFDGVLSKPLHLADLAEMIGSWCEVEVRFPDLCQEDPSDINSGEVGLTAFFSTAQADLMDMERVFNASDMDVIRRMAHRINGAAKMMGKHDVAELAFALELGAGKMASQVRHLKIALEVLPRDE